MTGVGVPDREFLRMIDSLAEVERAKARDYTSFSVSGKRFGYYWPRTSTAWGAFSRRIGELTGSGFATRI